MAAESNMSGVSVFTPEHVTERHLSMSRPRRLLVLAALAGSLSAAVAPAVAQASYTGSCLPGGQGPQCRFWTGTVPHGGVGDGDTLTVNYEGKSDRVRITGIQAMEMTTYSSYPGRRRGDCHSVEATNRLENLVNAAGGRVRIAAQNSNSMAGHRIRRSLAVLQDGQWVDVGRKLVHEGHTLWLPNDVENAWNTTYSQYSQDAAFNGRRLFDRDYCGSGPGSVDQLRMTLNYNAEGDDGENTNGEYAIIRNVGSSALSLAGWRFRDSALRWYTFPSGATVPAGKQIVLRMGVGNRTSTTFFWSQDSPPFENAGDGGYLFDPKGDLRAWVIYPCRFRC